MFTLNIEKTCVRAMLQFAAKKDIRYYLNAICFEVGANGGRMVATDGHILGCMDIGASLADPVTETQCGIIPREVFEKIKKPKRGEEHVLQITVSPTDAGGQFTVKDGFAVYQGELIDARFPDWRRVVPTEFSGEAGQFDADLLARLKAAHLELNGSCSPALMHSGQSTACARIGGDTYIAAVIMPIRSDALTESPFAGLIQTV
jgi:DNA polymerase-3 subunit beta